VRTRLTGQGMPAALCLFLGASTSLASIDVSLPIADVDSIARLTASSSFIVAGRAREIQSRIFPTDADIVHVNGGQAFSTRVLFKVRSLAALSNDAFVNIVRDVDGVVVPMFEELGNPALGQQLGMDRMFAVLVPRGTNLTLLNSRLSALQNEIEWADYDAVLQLATVQENEPFFDQQWAHRNTGQQIQGIAGVPDADMDTVEAWTVLPPLEPVIIAIIDSGVSQSHPEFTGIIVGGRNWTNPNTDAWDDDTLTSHGTQCAGIAAALGNNGFGIAGTAPNAKILVCKIATGTTASLWNTALSITWAVDNGARVLSMSLSSAAISPNTRVRLETEIAYAAAEGAVLVAATGNSPGIPIGYPAQMPSVIAVGSCNSRGLASVFQTTGPEMDVSAPGEDILTTVDIAANPNGFAYATGTSMAVPMVSGLAAIIWGINPALTGLEVRAIIESTVEDLGPPGWDPQFGHGRINVYKAVLSARDTVYCLSDIDYSGSGGTQDLFTFAELFFAGDLRADFDRNGLLNVDDVFLFLQNWFAGCV
jgi:Subtilase family